MVVVCRVWHEMTPTYSGAPATIVGDATQACHSNLLPRLEVQQGGSAVGWPTRFGPNLLTPAAVARENRPWKRCHDQYQTSLCTIGQSDRGMCEIPYQWLPSTSVCPVKRQMDKPNLEHNRCQVDGHFSQTTRCKESDCSNKICLWSMAHRHPTVSSC